MEDNLNESQWPNFWDKQKMTFFLLMEDLMEDFFLKNVRKTTSILGLMEDDLHLF